MITAIRAYQVREDHNSQFSAGWSGFEVSVEVLCDDEVIASGDLSILYNTKTDATAPSGDSLECWVEQDLIDLPGFDPEQAAGVASKAVRKYLSG